MCIKKILKLWMAVNILMIICSSTSLFAQGSFQMSVSGYVTNANTNLPKSDVIVTIFKWENEEIIDSYTAISDRKGFYKIRFLEAGKYEFHINTPEIGDMALMIHYWGGPIVSTFGDDCQFEMREGWNMTLNILIGENSYPYIERKNDILQNVIDFTVLYSTPLSESIEISYRNQTKLNYKTINIPTENTLTYDEKYYKVDDRLILLCPDKKTEAYGLTESWFDWNDKNIVVGCVDQKCQYSNIHPKWLVKIYFHSSEWYNKRFPKIPGCFYSCVYEHEMTHVEDIKEKAMKEWNATYDRINNSPCCNEICLKRFFRKSRELQSKVKKYADEREESVTNESNECIKERGCL